MNGWMNEESRMKPKKYTQILMSKMKSDWINKWLIEWMNDPMNWWIDKMMSQWIINSQLIEIVNGWIWLNEFTNDWNIRWLNNTKFNDKGQKYEIGFKTLKGTGDSNFKKVYSKDITCNLMIIMDYLIIIFFLPQTIRKRVNKISKRRY